MDRLTKRSITGKAVYCHPTPDPEGWGANRNAVLERCCQYEDTGLSPEEIMDGKMLTGWIPVEERLPKTPEVNPLFDSKPLELYLVAIKNSDYAFRAFWNGVTFTDGWSKLYVIAWMPLPEPYEPVN